MNAQYQQLYNQVIRIRNKTISTNQHCIKLYNQLINTIVIDNNVYDKDTIISTKKNNEANIQEINNSIIPIIKQNL